MPKKTKSKWGKIGSPHSDQRKKYLGSIRPKKKATRKKTSRRSRRKK